MAFGEIYVIGIEKSGSTAMIQYFAQKIEVSFTDCECSLKKTDGIIAIREYEKQPTTYALFMADQRPIIGFRKSSEDAGSFYTQIFEVISEKLAETAQKLISELSRQGST